MSPTGVYYGFHKILISSSESSDSESLLVEDINNGIKHINKEWEAIERTLYQEPGQQVTDPELLRECKLWRETFPHFRVKGTKIEIKQADDKSMEANHTLEAIKNNFNLQKLEEKRESIKKKIVGELVERIIAKYGFDKDESANSEIEKNLKNGVRISAFEETFEKTPNNINKSIYKNSELPSENESYFERGKHPNKNDEYMTAEQVEKNLYEIFDSWEKDCKTDAKFLKNCNSQKTGNSLTTKKNCSKKPTMQRYISNKSTPPSNSLPNVVKPFEMTKKIDKKYEGLIEKIIERKYNELDAIRHCPASASDLEIKSYEETLKKLRKASGFDDYLKKKDMPKINKFNNNWLKRSELNCYSSGNNVLSEKTKEKCTKYNENSTNEMNDTFFEELKKEMSLNYKRPAKKGELVEEISLRRPKPFTFALQKKKSLSSKDFPKKSKKETKVRQQQNGLGTSKSELNFKTRVNSSNLNNSNKNNSNKGRKSNGNQNPLLPPIETGIICTELTGRPKIGAKSPTKKY